MQYTGEEIVKNQIITNFVSEGIQQQGIDVRIKEISVVDYDNPGTIPKEGKTKIPKTKKIIPQNDIYNLQPGYYELTFEEGCNIPNNCTLHFKTRSSLVRSGSQVFSGQFDAGFTTKNMGAFLYCMMPIKIYKGARVAQAIIFQSNKVNNLYDGQWQSDIQRVNKKEQN